MDTQFVEIFTATDDQPEMARRLLEAAGDTPEQVATVFGGFRVPAAVAEAAGLSTGGSDAVDAQAVEGQALGNTAVAQRPAPAGGVHAAGASLEGNEPAAGADHAEGTSGAPTDAEVLGEDPNGGASVGAPPPAGTGDDTGDDTGADDDGDDDGVLRGEALDDALRNAGLPLSGKAADKRARLAAHQAGTSN